MTPLGSAVVPLVYNKIAVSRSSTSASSARSGALDDAARQPLSASESRMITCSTVVGSTSRTMLSYRDSASTTFAPQSFSRWAISLDFARKFMGTGTAATAAAARMTSTYSTLLVERMATRSPAVIPSSRRNPAPRPTADLSSAKSTRSTPTRAGADGAISAGMSTSMARFTESSMDDADSAPDDAIEL